MTLVPPIDNENRRVKLLDISLFSFKTMWFCNSLWFSLKKQDNKNILIKIFGSQNCNETMLAKIVKNVWVFWKKIVSKVS